MRLSRLFRPEPSLSEQEVQRGLRMMTWEGMASTGFTSITTSGFLAAYALAIGANNFQIGMLASLPFIMQLLQIPSIYLVEKVRSRKAISVIAWFIAQLLWFPIALIPIFLDIPGDRAVSFLLMLIAIRGVMTAITNCSWNSWIRDLVPQTILGRFFSRRMALSTVVAAIFGLAAAFFVDFWSGWAAPDDAILGYVYVLLFGALVLGMASPILMAFMPEKSMQVEQGKPVPVWKSIMIPLKDSNFRHLMQFLLFWGFALNLAIPFFSVFMLQTLQFSVLWVIALAVLSQLFNILFLGVWGRLADRFGSKVILSICASLYIVVILGWAFTIPGRLIFTLPLIVILHIFAGIASAGVNLTVSTIGMKLAPQGESTAYLACASLATNLGAGLGPLAGGALALFFSVRQLTLDFTWISPNRVINLGFIDLTGLDFLFAIAFIIGLITLNTLTRVREEGEVPRETVLGELMAQPRASTGVSLIPLTGLANMFPFGYLKKIPGIDVAIGVTTYQLTETAKRITKEAARGRNFSSRVARALENGLSRLWSGEEGVPSRAVTLAENAARGAIQAAAESEKDTISLIRPTADGIINALVSAGADPEDTLRGVSRGIVEGAADTGVDLNLAAEETVESVREAAQRLGLDNEAAARVVRTARSTARYLEDRLGKDL